MKILLQNKFNYHYRNVNQPAYKGKSREFEKALDKVVNKTQITDAEKNHIIDKLKAALTDVFMPSRFIEKGSHNAVYKITTKYAARVPLDEKITEDTIGDKFVWGKKIFKDMTDYYGEPIMQYGKVQILPNAGKHIPAGVPEHLANKLSKAVLSKYYLEKYLPLFSRISQEQYNSLAQNLSTLNSMKFGPASYGVFDSMNPNNIVFSKKRLLLVDEIYTLFDKPYANTTAKLLEIFVNKATKDTEAPDAGKKVKYVRKIFQKTILAGIKTDLILVDSREDYHNFAKSLLKANIANPPDEVLSEIDKIERMNITREEKVQLVKKYIHHLFNTNHTNK